MAYGICGGIPQYLAFFSRYGSLQEAVCEEFLSLGGHLQEEPENLMLQELREPALYNSILTAVAHGASRQNDIATAVGRTGSQITFYPGAAHAAGACGKQKQPQGHLCNCG